MSQKKGPTTQLGLHGTATESRSSEEEADSQARRARPGNGVCCRQAGMMQVFPVSSMSTMLIAAVATHIGACGLSVAFQLLLWLFWLTTTARIKSVRRPDQTSSSAVGYAHGAVRQHPSDPQHARRPGNCDTHFSQGKRHLNTSRPPNKPYPVQPTLHHIRSIPATLQCLTVSVTVILESPRNS